MVTVVRCGASAPSRETQQHSRLVLLTISGCDPINLGRFSAAKPGSRKVRALAPRNGAGDPAIFALFAY
jgi:hypothetical protein